MSAKISRKYPVVSTLSTYFIFYFFLSISRFTINFLFTFYRPEEPPSNDVEESLSVVAETSGPKKVAAEDPTEEANVEEDREIGVSYEVNLADIELPATEFVENSENIRKLTNEVVEMIVSDDAAAIASSQEEVQPLVSVDEGTSSSNTMKIEEQLVFEEGKQPSLM